MAATQKQKYELKKIIKELETYKGRNTELVSVYIPSGYEMAKITNHLNQEQGTATNIKSTATKKNVIDALEKMIQHLKLFKSTPPNGLAVFSGNVAEREGQSDVKVWSIEPPLPLNIRIYRCDKEFVLEPLRDMCEDKEVYGLVVIDRRDANIALLKGKTIISLQKTHSEVPGKHKTGGQSAQRFERLREGATKEHFKKVAEYVKEQFLENRELKGIIVGGPGPTKYDWAEGGYITDQLKKKIIGIKDLSYTGEFGLQELVDKSGDILAHEEIMQEKNIMGRFFNLMATKPGMASYGYDEVKKNLENGAVDVVLISEIVDNEIIDELEDIAKNLGTETKIISTETREGVQLKEIGRIAAILRYELKN